MSWRNFFRSKPKTATAAKNRLQIIVTRERYGTEDESLSYLPQLQQELLQVIAKYESIDLDQVSLQVDRRDNMGVLELNVVLPEEELPPRLSRGEPAFT